MTRSRWSSITAAGAVLAAAVGGLLAAPTASAVPAEAPTLRMFATSDTGQAFRWSPKRRAYVSLPVYVETVGGTFDLRVSRPDYSTPQSLVQVVHDAGGDTTVDLGQLDPMSWRGLPYFFRVRVTDAQGGLVKEAYRAFCPNSYSQQRVDPDGADVQTFPTGCWGLPFTLGAAWGIDDGWATSALGDYGMSFRGPDGDYVVTLSVTRRYREMFGIAAEDASIATNVTVTTDGRTYSKAAAQGFRGEPGQPKPSLVPIVTDPDPATLPDLRTLPAFGISVDHRRGKDLLMFGANVWVDGDSLLDIEGFRQSGEDVMDAFQYFYDGDTAVGRAAVGQLEFDRRNGHDHWHLEQFAQYTLLDADQSHAATSHKQSFCIVPTDPIDLSTDTSDWRPDYTGLTSACGAEEALWIRETLPVGWGDTYYQSRAGQSFNITDLPNGVYYIAVTANPTGALFESDVDNNTSLRMVILEGTPGAREVCVPALHGLDAAGTCA